MQALSWPGLPTFSFTLGQVNGLRVGKEPSARVPRQRRLRQASLFARAIKLPPLEPEVLRLKLPYKPHGGSLWGA
jgi:hypothetical protein